jgi:hypothetical protein
MTTLDSITHLLEHVRGGQDTDGAFCREVRQQDPAFRALVPSDQSQARGYCRKRGM